MMNHKVMLTGLLLNGLLASFVFASVTVYDDAGTDGELPASGTTWDMSVEDAIDRLESEGYTVRPLGDGRYGVYDSDGVLEGHMTSTEFAASALSGSGSPAASSRIALGKIYRQNIFEQAEPAAQSRRSEPSAAPGEATAEAKPGAFYENIGHFGRLSAGAADVFYNKWEVGDYDGSTFGINPSVTWGETDELTLTAPLHIIDGGDDTIFVIGLDGAFKRPLIGKWENVAVGVHAYGMGVFGGDDTATIFGGGPFLAYNYRINEKWIISAGGVLEFTVPDEGDSITELVPGVNIGYNLSDNVALNGYLIHYKNLDSDVSDDAYTDIGVDFLWVKGECWSLSGGIKTATGLDYVDSTEIHLGSSWMF